MSSVPWLQFTLAAFLVALALELRRPLRATREDKLTHVARNVGIASLGLALTVLLQTPALAAVSRWSEGHSIGLLRALPLPRALAAPLAFLALDYTLWIWHRLNHQVRFLWRFHLVHHVDRDLDASTALRFHFGELGLSIGFRALQITAIGATPFDVWVWQLVLVTSILFHHSNTRLPLELERALVHLVVTPRMHGIHHSTVRAETDSNWSSILTVWDRMHRTLVLDVPQRAITIGVPAWQDPREVGLLTMLRLPFRRQRDDWGSGIDAPATGRGTRRRGSTLAP